MSPACPSQSSDAAIDQLNQESEDIMKVFSNVLAGVMFAATSISRVQAAEAETAKPAAAEAHPYTAKTPKLNRAQVDNLLAKPDQLVIVDVRRPDELGSIGGFPAYLSIQSKELEKNL